MLKINVITLFPQLIKSHLEELPFKKAISKGVIDVNLVNLRNYALNEYGSVDDKPYGGGTGMLLRIEPIHNALKDLNLDKSQNNAIILLSPKGKKFTQQMAKDLLSKDTITFISGRYEGIDARVEEYATEIVSIGDYVLSGGELPSLVIMEAVTRLIPGVLEKGDASQIESFEDDLLEYPQYTRPEEYDNKRVPEVLLSGNHAQIEKWRKENSKRITEQ